MPKTINILFIPVSSTSGIGEYTRSLIIANELINQFPFLNISFLLNKYAACSKICPFETHLCDGSATKDNGAVKRTLKHIKPALVIFDCAGRADHFKLAKELGAKVVFISQHEKKRRRGLGLRRLLNTDIHWVAQSKIAIKPINLLTKLKLNFFGKQEPKLIGSVFKLINKVKRERLLEDYQLNKGGYIVFNAGSGGHKLGSDYASDIYFQSAQQIAEKCKLKCIMVFGNNYPKELPLSNSVTCVRSMHNEQFMALMLVAKVVVISGGDTLLQAVELNLDCVVSAVSKDQPDRIKQCSEYEKLVRAIPSVEDLTCKTIAMLEKQDTRNENLFEETQSKGLKIAIDDIKLLLRL